MGAALRSLITVSNCGAALAWRSVFEIVKSIETPVGARRFGDGAVINGDLRSTAPGESN
jgi:hypothetical protein